MAWCSRMMTPLRVLINDMNPTDRTYSDNDLKKLLVTAADIVQQEVKFSKVYTTNYDVIGIVPEPTTDDQEFINFVVMKAACLTNQWKFNQKALAAGIRARCGPVSLDNTGAGSTVLIALMNEGFCAAYEEMKRQHNYGSSSNIKAVLTPFSHYEYTTSHHSGIKRNYH